MKNILKKQLLLGALALLGGCMATQAEPTFISTGQGRGADLNVRGGTVFGPGNFGEHDILRVRNTADLGNARKTYLRFDLSTLPSPANGATGVALGLHIMPAQGKSLPGRIWTFDVSGLKDGAAGENWDEKVVSWNNAPANDPTSPRALNQENTVPLGHFTLTGTGVAGQSVVFSSPEFLDFLKDDSDGEVTLILTRQEAGEGPDNDVMHIFASKESAVPAPPVLSVAFNGEKPVLPTDAQWAKLPGPVKAPGWENEIAAFEASDRKTPPVKGGIVFVGSSSIRKWVTLAQDFPDSNVLNRGFGGSHILDSVHYAQRIVTPYEPRMIVFYAGTNDIADGRSADDLLYDYRTFVAQVRANLPTTPIAFISVSPAPSRWAKVATIRKTNALIEQFCKTEPNLKFIDIFPLMLDGTGAPRPELFVEDQLHMNPAGYAIWVKAVAPYLPVR